MKKLVCAILLTVAPIAFAGNPLDYQAGGADAPVSGSAAGGESANAAPSLERCAKPLGTLAVSEPQDYVSQALQQYHLPSPTPLLRLMIQQSNCFQVVERGVAMQNLIQERALAEGGEMRQGQNVGRGQMVAADFVMTATVAFSESNSGGAALGAIGNLFGGLGSTIGAIGGGLKFKQAQTTITVADARSGMQVAAAEGNVEKADFALGAVLGGAGGAGYSNTAEGKVVAAALLNNYNNIVKSVRNIPVLASSATSAASVSNAASAATANGFIKGDILSPKIGGVKVLPNPAKSGKPVKTMSKGEESIFLGDESNGFVRVQTTDGEGWVDKMLVRIK